MALHASVVVIVFFLFYSFFFFHFKYPFLLNELRFTLGFKIYCIYFSYNDNKRNLNINPLILEQSKMFYLTSNQIKTVFDFFLNNQIKKQMAIRDYNLTPSKRL